MNQQAKGLDELFELEIVDDEEKLPQIYEEPEKLDDSEFIRQELKNLIETSKRALETATDAQSEEAIARNSEAVSKLIDSIDKTLNTLINLNKSEKDLKPKNKEVSQPQINTQNNQILVATSADIIEKITNSLKKDNTNE